MICFSFKILGDKGLERTTSNSMHKKIFWKHTYRNGHVCKVAHTHPKTHAHACTHCFYLWTSECVGHVYWSLKQAEEAIRPSEGGVMGHLMWCWELSLGPPEEERVSPPGGWAISPALLMEHFFRQYRNFTATKI